MPPERTLPMIVGLRYTERAFGPVKKLIDRLPPGSTVALEGSGRGFGLVNLARHAQSRGHEVRWLESTAFTNRLAELSDQIADISIEEAQTFPSLSSTARLAMAHATANASAVLNAKQRSRIMAVRLARSRWNPTDLAIMSADHAENVGKMLGAQVYRYIPKPMPRHCMVSREIGDIVLRAASAKVRAASRRAGRRLQALKR